MGGKGMTQKSDILLDCVLYCHGNVTKKLKAHADTPEVRLNLNLSPELMFYSLLFHLGLEKHFQSHNDLQLLLACQVHIAKLSFAKWTTNIKIFYS